MKRRITRADVLALTLAVVLPVLAYMALLARVRTSGAATVMMGAVAGSSGEALATMGLALLLRVYTVVVLPGIVVYAVAVRIVRRASRKIPRP
jgi:hypothetical protein